jgi:hypothetical protein
MRMRSGRGSGWHGGRRCLRARRKATRSRCQLGPRSREHVFRIGEEEEESMDKESGESSGRSCIAYLMPGFDLANCREGTFGDAG